MRTLALDCATEACTVALFEGDELLDHRHETIGRGHAERLVPMIAELDGRGRAQRIRVGLGPGSFTGARIALSTARSLAIAWSSEVEGFSTVALLAATARRQLGAIAMTVVTNAGHGEVLVQSFEADGSPIDEVRSMPIDAIDRSHLQAVLVGNRSQILSDQANERSATAHAILPDARDALGIDPSGLTRRLAPIYARPPDATPRK